MRKASKHRHTQAHLWQRLPVTPSWPTLPPAVQERVRLLLVQLLREAGDDHRTAPRKEGGDE